jgi:hypothetical protein
MQQWPITGVIGVGMPVTIKNIITTGMPADTTKSTTAVIMDIVHDMEGIIMDTGVTDMPVITITMDRITAATVIPVPAWSSSIRVSPVIIDMTTDQPDDDLSSGIFLVFRFVAFKELREEMAGM